MNKIFSKESQTSKLLIISLLFFSTGIQAQYFTVKKIVEKNYRDMPYEHPHFENSKAQIVVDSINADLLRSMPGVPDSGFGTPIPITDVVYDILRNDALALGIHFSYQGCGAYCENNDEYFYYDSKTGKRFKPSELFTTQGASLLIGTVYSRKNDTISAHLEAYKPRERPDSVEATESDIDAENIYSFLSECMGYTSEKLDDVRVEVGAGYFAVTLGRCTNHMYRAIDPFGEFTYRFVAKDWKPYLTDYGKHIFKL